MEASILISTKQVLGLGSDDDAFDLDISAHINSVLSTLSQIGVISPVAVDGVITLWDDLELPPEQLSLTKSYVFLKTQMLWDPPTTSYLINARNEQIGELEWRLSTMREEALDEST